LDSIRTLPPARPLRYSLIDPTGVWELRSFGHRFACQSRVFASAARCRAFPPVIVLSWNWSLVQSIAPATYRPHWFCEPTTPLAAAPVLWVSVTNAVGGRFRSPDSNLSASSTFLQSLDHPTLAAPPQRDSASHELSRPSAHPDHRVHYDGSCLPAGSAFRVWLPS
jgi:hypothetical protein